MADTFHSAEAPYAMQISSKEQGKADQHGLRPKLALYNYRTLDATLNLQPCFRAMTPVMLTRVLNFVQILILKL